MHRPAETVRRGTEHGTGRCRTFTERHSGLYRIQYPNLAALSAGGDYAYVLGLLGSFIGDGLVNLLLGVEKVIPWALPTIIGGFMPLLVMTGMHYSRLPAYVNSLSTLGYETIIRPGNLPSNIAQGAAAIILWFIGLEDVPASESVSEG